jgi:hypothetical protein
MRRPEIIVGAVMLVVCLGCKADAVWQQDYGAFLQELADLASKAKGSDNRGYDSQLEDKEVTWVLTFEKIGKDKDGNDTLQFDTEPFDIGNAAIVLRFKPAPGTSESWKATPSGKRVKVSAVVADVTFDKWFPGNDLTKAVFVAAASVENVRRVND